MVDAVRLDGELAEWGRLPDVAHELEQSVDRLLGRARHDAAARTAERLGGLDLPSLVRPVDGRTVVVHRLDPATLDELVAARFADSFLASQRAAPPFVKQVLPGRGATDVDADLVRTPPSPALQDQAILGGFVAAMRAGCSFVIHRVEQYDHGFVQRMFRDLDLTVGCGVGANCYVSRDGGEGFGVHWDDHDVLVLHLDGRKLWEVFAPTQLSPLPDFVQSHAVGVPVWSGVLEPGTVLFIPRGFPHRVEGLAELSVHLTVAINRPTVLDLVAGRLNGATAPDDPGELGNWVEECLRDGPTLAELHRRRLAASLLVRHRCALADVDEWWAAAERGDADLGAIELLLPAATVFESAPDGRVRWAWNGLMVDMSDRELRVLERLPDIDAEELPTAFSVIKDLLRWGLAAVRPGRREACGPRSSVEPGGATS